VIDALAILGGLAGWLALGIGAVLAWRDRDDPTRARIPDALRIVRWTADPETGRVVRRVVVEGLPPEEAARIAALADRLFRQHEEGP
jgi:hypothetical protein